MARTSTPCNGDFYVRGSNEGSFLTITLSGVAAGTYDFELWFSDVQLTSSIVQQRVDLSTNGWRRLQHHRQSPRTRPAAFAFTYTANGRTM